MTMKQNDRDMLIKVCDDVNWIRKEIEGNGKAGLIKRVAEIEKWKYLITGALIIIAAALGINMGGLI